MYGQTIWALHNLTPHPVTLTSAGAGAVTSDAVHDLLAGAPVDPAAPIVLGPYGVRWLARQSNRRSSPD